MLKRRPFIMALLSLPFINRLALSEPDASTDKKPAFNPGEKLTYGLGWEFIVVGRATTEVLPDEEFDGRKVRNFRMTARTKNAIDHIYKVRDKLTSKTEYDVSRALTFRKIQNEGKEKHDETINFDWEKMEAHYHDAVEDKTRTISIPPNTLDPLSAFYFVRNQPFKVGSVIKGPLTDGKKCKIAELKVVKRETIKVNGKKYDTFKLIPDIKDVNGVFKKSKGAGIAIWCTADHRHIPVLMKSKVIVGSFKAELEHMQTA